MTTRVALWSGPRNISTALMYSFAQRADTTVVDEPLYAHYLSRTHADAYHPGSAEVLATQNNSGAEVIADIFLGEVATPVLFLKNMTHHLVDLDWSFMAEMVNVILTRDPVEMLPSYAKQIPNPSLADTGYAEHLRVLEYLHDLGRDPIVLDGKQVLLNPRGVLQTLCQRIGIPFDAAMLSWPAGPRPEDGSWAPYWYASVHRSTGFQPYKPKTTPFPDRLRPLLAECQPLYKQVSALAIQANSAESH